MLGITWCFKMLALKHFNGILIFEYIKHLSLLLPLNAVLYIEHSQNKTLW